MAIYDCNMRQALVESLIKVPEFNNDDTFLINELDICGGINRADVAIVNGQIHGYEIKSPQDNLDRLPSQVSSYNQVFDTMTIVTCEKYLTKVEEIIPKWWGIYYISKTKKGLTLKTKRRPKYNKNVSGFQLAQLLWKDEQVELIRQRTDITKGLKSKTRYQLALLISEKIPKDEINDYVRQILKHRESWKAVQLTQLYDDLHNMIPNL